MTPHFRQSTSLRWAALLAVTVLVTSAFAAARLSGALLLGPLAAAIALAARAPTPSVPQPLYVAAQAIVGCMIARRLNASLFQEIWSRWPLFVLAVGWVILAACLIGWLLSRWRVLPGTTAVWGAFPGAATAMTIMAEAYGADVRLVAFMQYLRVVMVALVASGLARVVAASGTGLGPMFPPIDGTAFVETLGLATVGGAIGRLLRVPAGVLLVPMALGAILQDVVGMRIELPPALLASAYAVVGWRIGGRFDRATLAYAAQALPRAATATAALITGCGLFAAALVVWAGIDPLTAYLAMSPGGADSVAIIAASSHKVDVPFVMALQVSRFLVILAIGPRLARFVARHAAPPSPAE